MALLLGLLLALLLVTLLRVVPLLALLLGVVLLLALLLRVVLLLVLLLVLLTVDPKPGVVIRGSILVDAPTGAHGIQLNLVLGAFAQACKADFEALCVFRLCLVRAYHDDPPVVEGTPSLAQRRRIARHRMGRKGSFAVPLIESFLVPCHPDTFLPDRAARRTLNIVLNITAAAHDVQRRK